MNKLSDFKVGDEVVCISKFNSPITFGMRGKIIEFGSSNPPIGVQWYDFNSGHDINNSLHGAESFMGWYVYPDVISLTSGRHLFESEIRMWIDEKKRNKKQTNA